jgi:hypothetical protein
MLSNFSRFLKLKFNPINNNIFKIALRGFAAKTKGDSGSDREVDKTKKPTLHSVRSSNSPSDSESKSKLHSVRSTNAPSDSEKNPIPKTIKATTTPSTTDTNKNTTSTDNKTQQNKDQGSTSGNVRRIDSVEGHRVI